MTLRTILLHACIWLLICVTVHACVGSAEHVRAMTMAGYGDAQ